MNKKSKISVLFVSAELAPLVKVGGLGDVVGALPKALVKLGADIKIIVPYYGCIDQKRYQVKKLADHLSIRVAGRQENFSLYKTFLPGTKIPVYLVKHRLFNSREVYLDASKYFRPGSQPARAGDVERFALFNQAVAEVIYARHWVIDVVHHHDWHTALVPTYIDEYSIKYSDFPNIKSLFTIHNLANQGITGLDIVDYAGLHHDLTPALMEDYYDKDGRVIDLMKVGILSADFVSTVSPSYAQEILTKDFGGGLEKYLQRRQKNLVGIINGIDLDLFDPKKDQLLSKQYSRQTQSAGKQANKAHLQAQLKLVVKPVPVFGLVSRIVRQKGFDILLPALEKFLTKYEAQVIILGTGDKQLETELKKLEQIYPDKLKVIIGFDLKLAQNIYASSDFFLMPSLFEPCGLGQMIAMRYGSLPIVRATGGLKDTVKANKNGLVFKKYQAKELLTSLEQAIKLYNQPAKMKGMISLAMQADWSWRPSAEKYLQLYKKLINSR